MTTKKTYTKLIDVSVDIQLYGYSKQGGTLELSLFPVVSRNRWQWFVDNWINYKQRFVDASGGDQTILAVIDDLEREVDTYSLGNPNNPFADSTKLELYQELLDLISLSEMNLTPEEIRVRDEELRRTSELEEEDFRNMLEYLDKLETVTAQSLGLEDPIAQDYYGVSSANQIRTATIQDMERMDAITETIKIIQGLIYDIQLSKALPPNLIEFANTNIDRETSSVLLADIFQTYVPVPFEISLEHMSQKYLGTSDFWYELATVNNLQPPFVDESGEKFVLNAPGATNNVIISSLNRENVAPGVTIRIGSSRYPEETRVIERIVFNDDGTMILFLSGAQDLKKFTPTENAFVRIFKPATIRKNSFVLIPSSAASTSEGSAKKTPEKDEIRRLERAFIQFGVDIERNEKTRDLVINENGDFGLAYGNKAVRQSILNTLKIRTGELPFHPNFGINYNIGENFYGSTDEAVIFGELIRTSVLKDLRVEQALISKLSATNTGISLQLLVKIKGFDQLIPLAFVS